MCKLAHKTLIISKGNLILLSNCSSKWDPGLSQEMYDLMEKSLHPQKTHKSRLEEDSTIGLPN